MWAKYLSMLAALLMFLASFGFRAGFWLGLLNIVISLFLCMLEFLSCFKCFSQAKTIDEKLNPLRTPLYKGLIYIVAGLLYWKSGWLAAIIAIVSGAFYLLGSMLDKKGTEAKAPMV